MQESDFTTGRVKWFNGDKGYGFISGSNGGPDVFLHIKELTRSGVHTVPTEGQSVKYVKDSGPKGPFAKQISLTEGSK
jgi:CspA family cold shock protein